MNINYKPLKNVFLGYVITNSPDCNLLPDHREVPWDSAMLHMILSLSGILDATSFICLTSLKLIVEGSKTERN
jgi:hypothetical protein